MTGAASAYNHISRLLLADRWFEAAQNLVWGMLGNNRTSELT